MNKVSTAPKSPRHPQIIPIIPTTVAQPGRFIVCLLSFAYAEISGEFMAERQGFEPWRPLRTYTPSKRADSTALTPLRRKFHNLQYDIEFYGGEWRSFRVSCSKCPFYH